MIKGLLPLLALAPLVAFPACSSGGDCSDTEVEVAYLNGDKDGTTECVAIPADCGTTADCSNAACQTALYGLCSTGYLGVSCSDTAPPTIISCNP